jgi:putative transposase
MGRVGVCGDNAAMESFFSLLQKNVLDTRRWRTREDLRLAIVSVNGARILVLARFP